MHFRRDEYKQFADKDILKNRMVVWFFAPEKEETRKSIVWQRRPKERKKIFLTLENEAKEPIPPESCSMRPCVCVVREKETVLGPKAKDRLASRHRHFHSIDRSICPSI